MMTILPNEIVFMLKQDGTRSEDVLCWMMCDRRVEGGFGERYLALDERHLYLFEPLDQTEPAESKTFGGYAARQRGSEKKKEASVRQWTKKTWEIKQIEAVSIVNLVAAGMLVLKEPKEQVIGIFTNGQMKQAVKLVQTIEQIKQRGDKQEEQASQAEEEKKNSAHDEHRTCPTCGRLYPEEDRRICPKCVKKHAVFGRLLGLAKGYKLSIVFIVVCMLLNSVTSLAIPYFMGTVLFDQALGGVGTFAGKIGLVVALIIGLRTLSLVFGTIYGVLLAKLATQVTFDLKATVFTAMQRLSLQFFMRKQTGQLMTRVNNDATELQFFFVEGLPYFIVNAMNIIGITGMLLWMDWRLTLICLLPMPLVIWLIQKTFPRLWRLTWRRHRRMSALNSVISDSVRGSRVVKAFGKERAEIKRFGRENTAFSGVEQRFNKLSGTMFPLLSLLTQAGGILIWAFGGWKVMQGQLTFGVVLTFMNYMYMLYGPIQFMNNVVGWWSYCMSAAQRIFEIQDSVPDVVEASDPIELATMKGDIVVDRITFGYEPNKRILKQVSMHAKPGQMIGVVGHSGAGKSTLVNLVSRLYDVNEGEIRLDGVPIKDISTDSLRRHIGIVSQDVYVFSGSVAENIAYANPDCTMTDIIHAAKIGSAHDFISKLPDGYDTQIGSGGHNLSGGEKQRLSIARAVLHSPRILILDEATASLDTETELQIQQALESLIKGRTTIAIAHRLSTLRNADYLVVMDKGEVTQSGTHDELMHAGGMYRELVRKHDEALKMEEEIIA